LEKQGEIKVMRNDEPATHDDVENSLKGVIHTASQHFLKSFLFI
jgi:hypothetical protein